MSAITGFITAEKSSVWYLVCENCHFHLAVYTPEILSKCPKCGNTEFTRRPFEP